MHCVKYNQQHKSTQTKLKPNNQPTNQHPTTNHHLCEGEERDVYETLVNKTRTSKPLNNSIHIYVHIYLYLFTRSGIQKLKKN